MNTGDNIRCSPEEPKGIVHVRVRCSETSCVGAPPAVHDGPATVTDPTRFDADVVPGVDRFLEPAKTSLDVDDRPIG
jgi:hypothetical protein